jgi:adenosylhomocysteine nucleosidase
VTKDFKIGIVAALEREVWPLVKDWQTRTRAYEGRSYKIFEKAPVVLVCGGIGAEAARRAAEAIIGLYQPVLVVSTGFAGGLDPALRTGDMLNPRHVVDARDGSRTDAGAGEGVLVTFEGVADAEQKARLGDAFGAHAVDMEAAAVARSAEAHGLKFLACKVVSDVHDSRLPPIMRFVGPDGRFHPFAFVLHVAVRPWLWAGVVRLAGNSTVAAKALCEVLSARDFGAAAVQPEELVGSKV